MHALVLTGGGTEREVEEKNAFAALCGAAEVRLTVADLPDGRLPEHWGEVKHRLAEFRRSCEPDLVFGPQRGDSHQDHRLLAELIPTEFRDHLILGYEILKWESDLPNPNVYQPIGPATAERKATLLQRLLSVADGPRLVRRRGVSRRDADARRPVPQPLRGVVRRRKDRRSSRRYGLAAVATRRGITNIVFRTDRELKNDHSLITKWVGQ